MQSKYANGETSKGDELRFGRKYPGEGGRMRGGGEGERSRAVIQLKMSMNDKAVIMQGCPVNIGRSCKIRGDAV